jgi:hypothetical protein
MNTRGACENEAQCIKEIKCKNFCSYECYLLYIGKKKPSIPERKKFDDPERQRTHDLYRWALGGEIPEWIKAKERLPSPDEWIVGLSEDSSYLWDDFKGKYVRYVLGKGIVSEFGKVVADESSEYYRAVIDRINEVQFNPELLNRRCASKPIIRSGVKKGAKRGPYKKSGKKKYTFVCKGCGRAFPMVSKRKKEFHSETCRRRYWRRKKKQKDSEKQRKRKY